MDQPETCEATGDLIESCVCDDCVEAASWIAYDRDEMAEDDRR